MKKTGILNTIHDYKRRINSLKTELDSCPEQWAKFQKDLDQLLEVVFRWFAEFERSNVDDEKKIYKMKRLFIEKCRPIIRLGKYNRHVIDKPFGYHGDFMIIDEIYKNKPDTIGIERCMDNYFLKTAASIATRNRKEDFKKYLLDFVKKNLNKDLRILDLASGPCTDIIEFFDCLGADARRVFMDCLDHDANAIEYSKEKLKDKAFKNQIRFLQKNAIKLALTKNIGLYLSDKYDLIFSTGLFDYLDEKISTLLIKNMKELLAANGILIISNYRDRWSNPSRHFMEWGGDWELVYRLEDEFLKLFVNAGFSRNNLSLKYEPLKVMQYCFAHN
jgi:SAM-dependent methyltransferase